MLDGVVAALDEVIERERRALLAGDFEAILKLATRKERLVQQLDRGEDIQQLQRLDAKIRRNGELLAAAAEGLRSAIDRIRAMAAPAVLTTYDGAGQRREFEPKGGELLRRS